MSIFGSRTELTRAEQLLAFGIWETELPGGEWQRIAENNPGDQEQSLSSTNDNSRVRLGITFPNPGTAEKFFRAVREMFNRAGVSEETLEQAPLQDVWGSRLEVVDARGQFHKPVAGYLITDRVSMEKVKVSIAGDLRL